MTRRKCIATRQSSRRVSVLRLLPICLMAVAACHRAACADAVDEADGWFGNAWPINVMHDLSVPKVEQELKLTPEQRESLAKLSPDLKRRTGEVFGGVRIRAKAKAMSEAKSDAERTAIARKHIEEENALNAEFRPKIWKVLTPVQRVRFQQLLWQDDVATALLRDKRVQAAVPISKDQSNAIREAQRQFTAELRGTYGHDEAVRRTETVNAMKRRNKRALGLLTEEQKAKWSDVTGEPFDTSSLPSHRTGEKSESN